ncbi:MAG: CHAD domain-containing protein [Anaerolineae bacterium]|nr:CHAD domain-containing protein [Anaerolineae bacterium]
MDNTDTELIDILRAADQPIEPQDTMAEAGRKVLLRDFIRMLEHEAGSRTGEDIEDVHDMRVATRRMRSALRLLEPYFKNKTVRVFRAQLKKTADALGAVRDLDVMIDNLSKFQELQGAQLQGVIALLDTRRQKARADLVRMLDKNGYQRFVTKFAGFATTVGARAHSIDHDSLAPSQLRHLLPAQVYEHLGAVRAYDPAIEEGDSETLHALRIEFKRLRYLVHFFSEIMGASVDDFLIELKTIQDHLGTMQDIQVATDRLEDLLPDLDDEDAAGLSAYLDSLNTQLEILEAKFPQVWKRFNSPVIQRKLASALVAL